MGLQDCGPTALKMLIAYLYQDERFLFIQETWERPSTFKNLLEFANHFGITLKGYKLHHPSSVRGIKKPFIALMRQPHSHYVTVIPLGQGFKILDPNGSQQNVTDRYFQEGFSGYILLVKHLHLQIRPDLPMNQQKMKVFFLGSYGLFTSLLFLWFWQPIDWMVMTMIMAGLTFIWISYVYRQVKHLDQVMIKHYLALIVDTLQFKRFHQWKQGWFGLPLNKLYRCLVLTGTIIYICFASPIFLIILGMYHGMISFWIPRLHRHYDAEVTGIAKLEKSLKYPFISLKDFQLLSDRVYQLVRFKLRSWMLAMLLAIALVSIYQQLFHFEAFLTWFTMVSLLIITYHHHYELSRYPIEKKEWRQLGFIFLNSKDYDKIKV